MRGEDDRDALLVELTQEIPHRAADLDVDARRRLIEDQQLRLMHQRARDHQPALHAARQRARHAPPLVPEGELPEILLGALAGKCTRDAVEAGLVDHDGLRRLEHVEVEFLGHDPDAGLGALEIGVEVVAEDLHRAGGLGDERGADADEGALAGAIGPEQGKKIPLSHLQVYALQSVDTVSIPLGEAVDR